MKEKFSKIFAPILISIFELVVGILLIVDASTFTSYIFYGLGGVAILAGIVLAVKYFRAEREEAAMEQMLFKGLIFAALGIFCIVANLMGYFTEIMSVIAKVYGILLLVVGLYKVQKTADMLRAKKAFWYVSGISALLNIICAVVAIFISNVSWIWIFLGVVLIVEAIVDVVAAIMGNMEKKEVAPAE